MSRPRLTVRALNRALLSRQFLLHRADLTAEQVISHLVGMQAQAPQPPYVGLWSRLAEFDPQQLSTLLLDRRAVRIAMMRGTVHLVTAADCLALRPVLQPVLDRGRTANAEYRSSLSGLDIAGVLAAGTALLNAMPLTPKALGERLSMQWPDRDPAALAHVMRCSGALVQLPPRGLWRQAGQTTYMTAERWLNRPLGSDPAPDDFLRRYLRAFGPATVADAQTWSGLPRLGDVFERLRPELRTFSDESGRELFDIPDGDLPDADVPAPVRFLPEFDNLGLSHADRARIIAIEHRPRTMTRNGIIPGTVLVGGFAAGLWKVRTRPGVAHLTISPFASLSKRAVSSLTSEGGRLLGFLAPDDEHDLTIDPCIRT